MVPLGATRDFQNVIHSDVEQFAPRSPGNKLPPRVARITPTALAGNERIAECHGAPKIRVSLGRRIAPRSAGRLKQMDDLLSRHLARPPFRFVRAPLGRRLNGLLLSLEKLARRKPQTSTFSIDFGSTNDVNLAHGPSLQSQRALKQPLGARDIPPCDLIKMALTPRRPIQPMDAGRIVAWPTIPPSHNSLSGCIAYMNSIAGFLCGLAVGSDAVSLATNRFADYIIEAFPRGGLPGLEFDKNGDRQCRKGNGSCCFWSL